MFQPQTPTPGSTPLFKFKNENLADNLDQNHPLIRIAKQIDWNPLVESFYKFYRYGVGRPILAIRLMIGLLMLKFMYNLSDEAVVAQWKENIYYQAFTGGDVFVDTPPCSSSQLALFRKRIGQEGCDLILKESVRIHGPKVLEKHCVADTTVQEANITFPTDFKLILKAINLIKKIGKFLGVTFRLKYTKEIKNLKSKVNFSKSESKLEDSAKAIKRLREIANSLLTTLQKKIPEYAKRTYQIKSLLFILYKVINQKKGDKNKIYSIHEPQTKCIVKGKAHKKYEFGSKVSLVLSKNSQIILGILNCPSNPYDGDTLEDAIKQLSLLHNGYTPEIISADRGYRGRSEVNGVKIVTPYDNNPSLIYKIRKKIKNLLRARIPIEPIIGHLKQDHRLSRNHLKGILGDNINPLLAGAAFNLLKYARTDYNRLVRHPRSLTITLRPKKNKYHGLPLWRPPVNPLFPD
jgi:IS5 family transposase